MARITQKQTAERIAGMVRADVQLRGADPERVCVEVASELAHNGGPQGVFIRGLNDRQHDRMIAQAVRLARA